MKYLFFLCRFNKNKFHSYIEGYPHLVVIVRLTKERVIAGYLNMPFLKGPNYHGDQALLMMPTEQNLFHLKEGHKAFTYDDYYLIIGNSELRIKTNDKKIFSNFGILNSFFENQGKKADYFLGTDNR